MQFSFAFPPNKIRASLLFAACHDIRYYLNGVMFTKAPNGRGMLAVSTDGHRLTVVFHEQDVSEVPDAVQVIVPRDELTTAAKNPVKAGRSIELEAQFTVSQERTTDEHGTEHVHPVKVRIQSAVLLECQAIDGRYPDFQKVIPRADRKGPRFGVKDVDGETGNCGLNAAYLADYLKAAKALGLKNECIRMRQRVDGYANLIGLSGCADFISVLMPAREEPPELPEWMAPREEMKEAA